MPPCCAARGAGPNCLPSLHLLSLHETTGVKVKNYRSGENHPDERVREAARKWEYKEDECSICKFPLDEPSDIYPGGEKDPEALEIEVLVENPTCKHAFHRACLQPSVQAGILYCPVCRSVLKQSVLDDLAPGMGYVELENSSRQSNQRGYEGFYDARNNEEMREQNVDPSDEVDHLSENDLKNQLSELDETVGNLSKLVGEPEFLTYGLEAVKALLTISSNAERKATMEKLQLWHHASTLLRLYIRVHAWPRRALMRNYNHVWFELFDNAMLYLRMDLPELRKVLIYKRLSGTTASGRQKYLFNMGEKEFSDLPGLDAAIDLVEGHKKAAALSNEPYLSDKQVKAFEFYITEARSLPEQTKSYLEENPPETDDDVQLEIEMTVELTKTAVEDMLKGLQEFLPGVEKYKVDSIQETTKKVLSELVERFPEAEEVMEDVGYQM